MRELDELLVDYLDRYYQAATDDEKSAFRELLELSDPELMGYLLQNEKPGPRLSPVIETILNRTRS